MNPNVLIVTGASLMVAAMYLPKTYDNSPWAVIPAIAVFIFGVLTFSVGFAKDSDGKGKR